MNFEQGKSYFLRYHGGTHHEFVCDLVGRKWVYFRDTKYVARAGIHKAYLKDSGVVGIWFESVEAIDVYEKEVLSRKALCNTIAMQAWYTLPMETLEKVVKVINEANKNPG